MKNMYKKAYLFAKEAHLGQKRKRSKAPYISHPLKVFNILKSSDILFTALEKQTILIIALLHDVIEDTKFTYKDIEKEFGPDIAKCVKLLSKDKTETKDQAIKKACVSPITAAVKLADRIDNITDCLTEQIVTNEYIRTTKLLLKHSKKHKEIKNLREHLKILVTF